MNDEDEDLSYETAAKQAQKITDAQIKKYWKREEDSRLAPRGMFSLISLSYSHPTTKTNILTSPSPVHQQTIHTHEKILRHFDLSSEYGPCIGIPRLQRWKRAHSLALNPPVEVLAVLLKEEAKEQSSEKGEERVTGKIAYVDELGGGKVAAMD